MRNWVPYFSLSLKTPDGRQDSDFPLMVSSLEEAYLDVLRAIPDTASGLLRDGADPMACAYVIANEAGIELMEISFTELVRNKDPKEPAHDGIAAKRATRLATQCQRSHILQRESRRLCLRSVELVEKSKQLERFFGHKSHLSNGKSDTRTFKMTDRYPRDPSFNQPLPPFISEK
jgi:hypothetical protein